METMCCDFCGRGALYHAEKLVTRLGTVAGSGLQFVHSGTAILRRFDDGNSAVVYSVAGQHRHAASFLRVPHGGNLTIDRFGTGFLSGCRNVGGGWLYGFRGTDFGLDHHRAHDHDDHQRDSTANRLIGLLLGILFIAVVWYALGQVETVFAMEYPEQAQEYLDAAPFTMEAFLRHPWQNLKKLLCQFLFENWTNILTVARKLFGLLLCAAACQFLVTGDRWNTLLEWVFACACFLLAEGLLAHLSQMAAEKSTIWKDFLYGFLPVFSSAMLASGQISGAAVCNGFFLTALSCVANILQSLMMPVMQMFLAITAAGIFSENRTAETLSVKIGKAINRVICWIGALFTGLMGIQRVFSGAVDNATLQTGKTILYSSIPIVGQAISSAVSGVAAGMKLLQSGLAFSALAIVGAECLPLYGQTMLCWAIFTLGSMIASLLGLSRCADMLNGMASGAYTLAAVLALFFGMLSVGILMMLILGGGRA